MIDKINLKFSIIMISLLIFGLGLAADLEVKSYSDRTVVGMNQQFTLSVEISGKDANSAGNPQLPNMESFAAFLGSGTSQNMQFINGRMSVSHTTNYYFQATKEGKFEIGAVTVTADGETCRTNPISIEIQKSAPSAQTSQSNRQQAATGTISNEDLFVRAIPNKRRVYVNEPVVVTYKIYTRVSVSSFGYTNQPGTAGFWVEAFDVGQQPKTSTEVLDGKQYTVATIKKMALFPMSAGSKTIDPLGVECEVRVRNRRSRDVFDSFFNDSMFGRSIRHGVQSEAVTVEVLPLPEEGRPRDFDGVVGDYRMKASVDQTRVKANEAITYKLVIEGAGNIQALPDPEITFSSDFEVYPPEVSESVNKSGNSVSGRKSYEYVLIPRVAGQQRIRPVRMGVFNPSQKVYQTISTREFNIDVAKGDEVLTAIPSGLSREEVKLLGQDIRFIKPVSSRFKRPHHLPITPPFFWAIITSPWFLVVIAIFIRKHQDRLMGDVAYARDRRASRAAKRRLSTVRSLQKVSTQKAFYAEVSKAMLGFLGDKLNIAEAGIVTDEAATLLKTRNVKNETAELYFDCLSICDRQRFSPADTDEAEMRAFLQKAESAITQLDREVT